MPLLKTNRVLLAKLESVVGTAESLADADGVFCAYDVEINPNIDFQQRTQQGGMSHLAGKTGAESCQLSFKMNLYGDGAAGTPAWANIFLPACGLVNKAGQVFSPSSKGVGVTGGGAASATPRALTMGVYQDNAGLKKVLAGATGNVRFAFSVGQMIVMEFSFSGVWQDVVDNATLPTPNYPPELPMSCLGATMTLAGAAIPCWSSLSVDLGNEVSLRPCATKAKGFVSSLITNRRVTGTLDPESTQVSVFNPYNDWTASTESALSLAVTDGTDTITIAAPKLQFTNVQEADRNGMQTDAISFQCNAASDAGDDELSLTFA
jgi:hypothetical protein